MSALAARKLAREVADLRASPDNKRCFNCETLGTTYYVPQFSIFVCTQCSGIHMQFAHRVKSVTLAEYKADEVEHMRLGGNQVAAYRYLARYTPDKDLRKPVDRNPQRIRTWIQTVFADKRYFSADAPIPRRSVDGAAAAGASSSTSLALTPSGSLRRSGSTREGSAATSPLPSPASAAAAAAAHGHAEPSSPPVRNMRELLGDRATSLQVGPKVSTDSMGGSSGGRAASVPVQQQQAVQAPAAPRPAPATPSPRQQQPTFDPFAAPETPLTTPAMPAMQATPASATPPAAASAAPAAAVSPAGNAAWAAFDDPPAFTAQPQGTPAAAAAGQQQPAGVGAAAGAQGSTSWASFGDAAFGPGAPAAAATPAAASPAPAAAAGASAAAGVASPAAALSPASPTGSSKGGKPATKELAADLFADFTYAQPLAQPGMYQQQVPYPLPGMQQSGYGLPQQQQQQPPQAHQAWAVQQQQALMWQHQQYQQQQQQQQMQQQQAAYSAMYGGMRPPQAYGVPGMPGMQAMPYAAAGGMNGAAPGAAGYMGAQQQPQQQGSGPPSASFSADAWSSTSAAAGVTEENAFADLVDLKKALPVAGSTSSGGGAPGFPAQQPYGMGMAPAAAAMQGMPGMPGTAAYPAAAPGMSPGYGMPSYAAPAYAVTPAPAAAVSPAAVPAYGMTPSTAAVPGYGMTPPAAAVPGYGQSGMGLQQQASFGSSWGMPVPPSPGAAGPATAAVPRVSDGTGNPFA